MPHKINTGPPLLGQGQGQGAASSMVYFNNLYRWVVIIIMISLFFSVEGDGKAD